MNPALKQVHLVQGLLLSGSAAVLALAGFYIYRAAGAPGGQAAPGAARAAVAGAPASGDPNLVQKAEQVKVDRWAGADRRYRVEAPIMEERESATVLRGGVRLTAQGSDGHGYVVTAREVVGEAEWSRIRASGGVHIVRDDGLDLTANWVEHLAKEEVETAGGAVQFRHQDQMVRCERLRYDVPAAEFRLDGAVAALDLGAARGRPALAVAEHARYARVKGEIELKGGAQLVAGEAAARADRIDVSLASGRAREVRLFSRDHAVEVEIWAPGTSGCAAAGLSFEAPLRWLSTRTLELSFASSGDLEALRQGKPATPVTLEGIDPPESLWKMTAATLELSFAPGAKPRELQATLVSWNASGAPGRSSTRLRAPEMSASFTPSGSLDRAEYPRGITIEDGESRLTGARASYEKGVLTVEGDPRLIAGPSSLSARTIEVLAARGEIRARGNVESESELGESAPAALKAHHRLLRFRSDTMESTNGGATVVYRGHARAWQGGDILQATEIRADKNMAGLEAEGSATAVFGAEASSRISLAADRLSQSGREIVLLGQASLVSPDLRLRADRIRIQLGEDRRTAERVEAEGKEVQGERLNVKTFSSRLVHDVASARTDLFGGTEPARLVDAQGEHSGASLTIWRQGDRILLDSGTDGVVRSRISANRAEPGSR